MRNYMQRAWQWARTHQAVLWVLALVLLIDRLSKCLTVALWADHPLIFAPYLQFNYVQNTGAAFGMMQNGNGVLIVVSMVIIGFLLKNWQEFCQYSSIVKWGLVLILGGALGNLYDRITLGFVVDFIDVRVWPVFNVADSCITIGGVLLAWSLCFQSRKKPTFKEEK